MERKKEKNNSHSADRNSRDCVAFRILQFLTIIVILVTPLPNYGQDLGSILADVNHPYWKNLVRS